MKQKKSIVGIPVWLLFTLITVGAIGQTLYTMATIMPESSWIREGLILGCIAVATICILIVIRVIALNVQKKFVMTRTKAIMLEVIAILIMLSVTILTRLYYIDKIDMSQAENIYFQAASVGADKLTFASTNHVTIIYVYILSFLLALLGNKISICLFFQLVLQCITLFFVYLTIRNISGKMTAFIVNLLLALSNAYISTLLPLAPENLLICIFMLGFWMISLLWKYMNASQGTKVLDVFLFLMAGLATAAIIYTDISGILLVFMSIGSIFVSNKNTAKVGLKKPFLQTIYFIIGSTAGVFLLFQIEAVICKESLLQIVNQYLNPWMTVTIHNRFIFPSVILEVSFVILLITVGWCIRYWSADHDENISYSLLLIGAVIIRVLIYTDLNYSMLLIFAWIFIAAASLKSVCCNYKDEQEIILLSDLDKGIATNQIDWEEMSIIKNSKKQNETQVKPNLIPNPLPLPKQHERKEMDYAFLPEEDKMNYDINVIQEHDDFDIL